MSIGTMAVAAVLAGIIAAIVVKLYRDRKKGKCSGCSCPCANK